MEPDLAAIRKRYEAGIPGMVSCPATSEDLHLTAEGYAYIGHLRTDLPAVVEALEEAQLAYRVTSTMLDEVVAERGEAQKKLAKLEPYAQHIDCAPEGDCDCGLDCILKEEK
ncbi:MAG: hypothetical protein IIC82_05275 [Chloroflexi bacterium]|nr:hypothetical protein [Chloroflexota bacterium]